mgnify:CR=1 FL=1|tara:strand:+ start:369 stop:842 length:474 start_codon:yes stop_codon:yes gene_type:complete
MKLKSKKIVSLLTRKKLKISVAESCTGGMLSSNFTSINGSSKVFKLGLVVYSNESKIKVLKIPKKIIKNYGAVSEKVCKNMVNNINKIGNTNLSIAVTGIAGPSGGSKKKPVGLVYVGIKKNNKINIKKYLFKNKGRTYIQKATVNKCLELILGFVK